MKIKVLDAMMGSGKTTRLIQDIANLPPDSKVIYITPLLTECHRIAGTVFDVEDEKKAPIVAYQDDDGIEEYVYDVNHYLHDKRLTRFLDPTPTPYLPRPALKRVTVTSNKPLVL